MESKNKEDNDNCINKKEIKPEKNEMNKEINNFNEIDTTTYSPSNCHHNDNNIRKDFTTSKAYSLIKEFIFKIDNSIKSEEQETYEDSNLKIIEEFIINTPLSDVLTRYTNYSMRTVLEHIEDIYLRESFGNLIRMDFGTGHELNFLCYLYRRANNNEIKMNQVFSVLKEYFRIVRYHLTKFKVEAAGARGCWSVDDYLLLPYLFGSSENFKRKERIEEIDNGVFKDNWNKKNSHMLENICKLGWKNINIGFIKMYDEEVLSKFVVTQHFIYTEELPYS